MANIEHVNVAGQVYDIRVPNGSSLSLSSLNVTGTITGANLNLGSGTITAGTANLSVVRCRGDSSIDGKLTFENGSMGDEIADIECEYSRTTISICRPDHSELTKSYSLRLPIIDNDEATFLTSENAPFTVIDNEISGEGVSVKLKNINHIILLKNDNVNNDYEGDTEIKIGSTTIIGPLHNTLATDSTYIDLWIVRNENVWDIAYFVQGRSSLSTVSSTISCGTKRLAASSSDLLYLQSSATSSTGVNNEGRFLVQQW